MMLAVFCLVTIFGHGARHDLQDCRSCSDARNVLEVASEQIKLTRKVNGEAVQSFYLSLHGNPSPNIVAPKQPPS